MSFYTRNMKVMLDGLFVVVLSLATGPVSAMTVEQAVEAALSNSPIVNQRKALESAASFEVASARKEMQAIRHYIRDTENRILL